MASKKELVGCFNQRKLRLLAIIPDWGSRDFNVVSYKPTELQLVGSKYMKIGWVPTTSYNARLKHLT